MVCNWSSYDSFALCIEKIKSNEAGSKMSVRIHHELYPSEAKSDKNIVILHGLFGSSKNWATVAENLKQNYNVYTLDARNHGQSEHSNSHTLADMVEDAFNWYNQTVDPSTKSIWLGHSMGGLTVMGLALHRPETVHAAIIADIAPKDYAPHHNDEFRALKISLEGASSRAEIDRRMAEVHSNRFVRQFLQMNLERNEDGTYSWKLNVAALENADYLNTAEYFDSGIPYRGKSLFLRGMNSNYIQNDDYKRILELFPDARIEEIQDADHWMHYTSQDRFIEECKSFLKSSF